MSTSATSASGDVLEQTGLAVIAVNGEGSKLTGNVWLDASGYALVSAPTIELSGPIGTFAPTTAPNDAKHLTNPKAEKTLLVFQYQNPEDGMFDISTIAEDQRFTENGGIYIDTENSALTFNSATLKSHADIIVDLGNKDLTLTGSTQIRSGYDSNKTVIDGIQRVLFEKKEAGTGTVQMSGTSGIVTEKLDLAGGATVVVNTGSTSYIGTTGKGTAGATLTLGGEGFSLGSDSEGANGLIDVQGNHVFAGGNIYYAGTGSTPDSTGLKASGSISMADGAKLSVLSLNNAILQGVEGINLSVDKLVMSNNAYMRGGDGSNTKSNIDITANSIELTDAFIGRDGSGWKNVQGETLNTTITANTINLDSSFILGEEKVTLNTTGTNSTLTITGSAEDTEIGLRTNGGISIGSAENPFQNVTISGQGRLQADGNRAEKNLEIYAHGIIADASANGTYGSQYTALNGLVKLHTNSINLKDDKSFINGAKGVEISSLNNETLNITIRGGRELGPTAGGWGTLTDHGSILGQYVDIFATNGVTIAGGALIASGFNENGKSITIDGGYGDTHLKFLWTDASSVNAGKVGIFANAGYQIYIEQSQIRDDVKEETSDGTLTIAINGLTKESGKTGEASDIRVRNSTISDDAIIIGSGYEAIYSVTGHFDPDKSFLMNASEFTASGGRIGFEDKGALGEITINTKKTTLSGTGILSNHKNGVQINSSESLSLSNGAHIGLNDGNTDTGSLVSIKTPSLTLDNTSYITSKGAISIGAFDNTGKVSIVMDEASTDTESPSWIKGQTVDISGNGINLAGGQISSTGNTGDDINITSTGGIDFENTSIDAGDDGNVNIVTGLGSEGSISGTDITGGSISFAGNDDGLSEDLDFGKIVIDQNSSIIAGTTGGNGGKINIGTGVNVVVSNNASLTANQGTNDESTGIDVNGGKLTIEAGGVVTSGNDVDVTGGGSIDFTGTPGTDVDAGKLVVGGNLTVGGTASDEEQVGGSINVDSDAIIIAKGENNQGNNVTIGSGGKINISNGSHLFVTNDEDSQPSTSDSVSGLTVDGDGTTVNIAGGTLIADQINTGSGSSVDNKTLVGSDSYISLENPFKDDSSSDLSFVIDGEANDIVLDITGNLEGGKLSSVLDAMKGHGTVMVSGKDNGLLSPEEWADKLGASVDDKLVISDAGIDLTEGDTTSKREQNSITQGGGGWLVGDSSQGSGSIQITGGESSDVYVTGAQTEGDRDGFEAIRDKDNKTPMGVHVTENSNLTFGNAGSYGGDVSAGITTEAGSNTNFIGGAWKAESITGDGNLNIIDKSKFETGVTVTVDDALHANDWSMSGDHTALNANNGASFDGKGHLSGGANAVVTGGSLSVGQGLTLEDNAVLTSTEGSEIKGGLTVENGTTFNEEKDLVVSGGNSNFHGTVNVDGNYTNTDENFSTIVTGTTNIGGSANTNDLIVGSDSFNGSGLNGSFIAGSANVGGNFVANTQSSTTINGDFTVKGDSSIVSGAQVTVDGGQANFNGGLHVSANGVFENKSPNAGTTVDNYLILDAGSNVIAGNEFKLSDKDVSIGTGDTVGTLNGHISASDLIDFSNANVEVTFTGENAGTDAHHIQAGASGNGITYTGGASHLFTKDDDDPEGGIVTGVVTVGTNGSLTMDADNFGQSDKANLIMNDSLKLSDQNSMVIVGDVSEDLINGPGIYLGSDSYFDLNASQFGNGDSIVTTGDDTGTIYLTDKSTININNWTLGTDGSLKVYFDLIGDSEKDITDFLNSDNALYNFWYEDGYLGMGLESSSSFGANNKFTDVVDAVLASDSENALKQSLVTGVFSKSSGFMTQQADGSWVVNELGNQRLQDVLGLPIAAGAFNLAYDAMSEMNQTMANRMAEPITAHSVSVWADVIATYNSADELFGNSGYSADIYAAVMGADVGITEDWIAGVAFTIGQGDADGEGDTMGIKNDADFYGFSVYTAKNVGQLRFSGDMGYLKLKNDISTDVNYGGKGDTDVITVGARMDMTVHQGEQFDVTPHFGIRYANFNIDTINGTATNDINVVEVPLGVTVKGKTSMNGWKVAPMVDVSVVPQFGDKKAKIWNSGVAYEQDVLDSALVKTSVGVSAQKGNFTFGLNYRLGAGNDERQNHSFNANIRYQF